jgi:MFS family permease
VVSLYYYGYAGMQIPLGILMDRVGAGRIIGIAAMLCGIATYLFAISPNAYLAGSARLLIGIGSACGYLGTLKLGSVWFPRNKMPYVVGLAMLLGTLGASLGTWPLEHILNTIGWHKALHFLACFGLILGLCIFLAMGEPEHQKDFPKEQHFFKDLFMILKMPQAWLLSIFAMLMYVPLTVIGDLWGISFLERKYDILESQASFAVISMFIGVGIGGPFFAFLSDYLSSRKKPMLLGSVITLLIYIVILFIPGFNFTVICFLFFMSGIFFNGQCLAFSCICEIMPQHASGVAIGFVNMLVMTSGFIFLPIVGRILVSTWDGQIIDGVPFYSKAHFQVALTIVPICLCSAALLCTFIKDTYHLAQETKLSNK